MLCPVGECGKIVLLTIFAKFTRFAGVYEPPDCLVLCIVGECGKTVVFAIFVKFSNIFSFLPFLLLRAFLNMSHNRPTELSACRWPYSWTGWALQRHRRAQGSNSRSSTKFSGFSRCCWSSAKRLLWSSTFILIRSSNTWMSCITIIYTSMIETMNSHLGDLMLPRSLRREDMDPKVWSRICNWNFRWGNKKASPTIFERNKRKLFYLRNQKHWNVKEEESVVFARELIDTWQGRNSIPERAFKIRCIKFISENILIQAKLKIEQKELEETKQREKYVRKFYKVANLSDRVVCME